MITPISGTVCHL